MAKRKKASTRKSTAQVVTKKTKKTTAKKTAAKKATKKKTTAAKSSGGGSKPRKSQKTAAPRKAKSFALPRILNSPDYAGKAKKLERDLYPEDSVAKDFQCFGPPATNDGEFAEVRICDLGCFTQDGKDSNKYYHGR